MLWPGRYSNAIASITAAIGTLVGAGKIHSPFNPSPNFAVIAAFNLLYRHRHILYVTSVMDIRSRYIGTMFGIVWAALYPFLFLGIYASVYAFILGDPLR